MFTKLIRMLVKARVRMAGHCDDDNGTRHGFGHCYD